jgi:hypothetical protein
MTNFLNSPSLVPSKLFLFTRNSELDYHWFKVKPPQLFLDLHTRLLMDQDANPNSPSTFFLYRSKNEIGIMVSRLKTERKDRSLTSIYNTLCLEFRTEDQSKVYSLAACLLDINHSKAIQQTLLLASEEYFRNPDSVPSQLSLPNHWDNKQIPIEASSQIMAAKPNHAYRSNADTCLKVAQYLRQRPSAMNENRDSVSETIELIVSTGLIDHVMLKDAIRNLEIDNIVALSRSNSISEDGTILKKKRRSVQVLYILLAIILLALFVLLILTVV